MGLINFTNLLNGMSRVIGIDYGSKRIGIAVTDPLKIIASGLTTVMIQEVMLFLTDYLGKEKVEAIVVGEPKNLDNTPAESAAGVEAFIRTLKKKFPSIPIYRIDERFSSKMAQQTMLDGGLKKKARQNKATIDMVSAAIILQTYLEMKEKGAELKPV